MPEDLRQEAESQGAASRKVAEGVKEIAEAFGGFSTADGGTLLEALKLHHQGIDTAGDRQEKKAAARTSSAVFRSSAERSP